MSTVIFTAGRFGADVAERMTRQLPAGSVVVADLTAPVDGFEQVIEGHDYLAVATWRPYVEACRALNDLCHRHGRSWSLAELSGTTLTCGPATAPGSGKGCYHCYVARTDAQKRDGDRSRVVRQAYARNPALGVPGFTPAMAAIAASALVEYAAAPLASAGRFRCVDVLTGTVLESSLVPLHDCLRCRSLPPDYDPTNRYLDHMLPELEKLLA